MSEPETFKKRRFWQIHLSTAILMVLMAGFQMLPIKLGAWIYYGLPIPAYRVYALQRPPGWENVPGEGLVLVLAIFDGAISVILLQLGPLILKTLFVDQRSKV